MPRLIVFSLDTGFIGMKGHEFAVFDDDITDDELNNEAWQRALNHADMYGIYPSEDRHNGAEDEEEDDGWTSDQYSDNIDGSWEDFDPEKHDGLVPGGGSATELFKRLLKEYNE